MQSSILLARGETVGRLVFSSNEIEILLTGSDLFQLSGDARGTRIASLGGILWITQKGDAQDYMLRPGEWVEISCKGMVLVQGIPSARVWISPAGHR